MMNSFSQAHLQLKAGLPEYMDEMEKMFQGIAVTGETSYAPGSSASAQYISSGEDDDDEEEDRLTPVSIGSKRSSSSLSNRSTAATPKKPKSPALQCMDNNLRSFQQIMDTKNAAIANLWKQKQDALQKKKEENERRMDEVMAAAREAGATEKDRVRWKGVLNILKCETTMSFFLKTHPEGRLAIIDDQAGVGN